MGLLFESKSLTRSYAILRVCPQKGDHYDGYTGYSGKGMGKGMGKKGGKGMGMKGMGMKGSSKGSSSSSSSSKGSKKGSKKDKAPATASPAPSPFPTPFFGTIVDFVVGDEDLTTLTAAVVRAGLVDALNGPGPLTLFAPNNAAFAALGVTAPDIVTKLFTDDDFIPQLQDLLLLHVLSGFFTSTDLSFPQTLLALNDEPLAIDAPPITVNGNLVVDADNFASNGVTHIIDGILIPSWVFNTVTSRVVEALDLSTLLVTLITTELDMVLDDPNAALTLVAPTDAAFATLETETPGITDTLLAGGPDFVDLTNILLYHVFPGVLTDGNLVDGFVVTSLVLAGLDTFVSVLTEPLRFNDDSFAVSNNLLAANGNLIKIDRVLDLADSPVAR